MGDHLDRTARGVEFPNAAIEVKAVPVGPSRPPDLRDSQDAVASIEPAIGSPGQAIESIVFGVDIPAIEHDFRRTIWLVITIPVWNEKEFGQGTQPDAAETKRDSRKVSTFVQKYLSRIELPVPIPVLENYDPVISRPGRPPLRVGEAFNHPEAAPGIGGHGNGLDDIRLPGKQRNLKPLWHGHSLCGILQGRRSAKVRGFCGKGVRDEAQPHSAGQKHLIKKGGREEF
jgi:hypothetical protein